METKSKRIKLSKSDDYIALQESFGWVLVSKDDPQPDETIVVTMERDKDNFSDYEEIRQLEKAYTKINRPIPIATIVFALLGGLLIVLYFLLKGSLIAIACLYGGLTSLLFMVFTLIVWLIIFIKRKKLLKYIIWQVPPLAHKNPPLYWHGRRKLSHYHHHVRRYGTARVLPSSLKGYFRPQSTGGKEVRCQ